MSKIASTAATFWTDTPFGSNSGCKSALQPVQGVAQFFGALSPETLPRRGVFPTTPLVVPRLNFPQDSPFTAPGSGRIVFKVRSRNRVLWKCARTDVSSRKREHDFGKSYSPMSTRFCSFYSIANIKLRVVSDFSRKLLILRPKDNLTMVTKLLVSPPNPADSGSIDPWRDIQNEANSCIYPLPHCSAFLSVKTARISSNMRC